jgi:hypothetical protein
MEDDGDNQDEEDPDAEEDNEASETRNVRINNPAAAPGVGQKKIDYN